MSKALANPSRGFTLIELMVTLAVIAILAMAAIPSLRDFVHGQRLRAGANELVASLQAARMEAVRLNTRAVVCRSSDGATCIGSDGPWARWVALADLDHDGAVDDLVRVGGVQAPATVLASSNVQGGSIVFRPDGLARTPANGLLQANMDVCIAAASLPQNIRRVALRTGSRLRTTRESGGGQCSTPANP